MTLTVFMLYMFQQMADPMPIEVVERFFALSTAVRGCAILGPDGVVAATGERSTWLEAGSALLGAADTAANGRASHAHVATEEGEAYAVRASGLAMVAVTDRFTLASLVFADMRASLRAVQPALAAAPSKAAR